MHIGLVIYDDLDTLSGGYLYDRKLVASLETRNDQVTILSLPGRGYLRNLAHNLSQSIYTRLLNLAVDILLQDELAHPSLFWINQRLQRKAGYPIISIVHHLRSSEQHPAWQTALYRQVERRYLNSLDGFIFNSQTTCRVVESLLSPDRLQMVRSTTVHPAGDRLDIHITDEQITQRSCQEGPLHIFFLGNVIPRKGLHILLSALQGIPWSQWDLRVAGRLDADLVYARRIRRLVTQEGMGGSVHFLGPISETNLVQELVHSHLLVIPSSYEGFGIAYLEGMRVGLPAIATSAGAASEIVTDGQDGFLVPPGDKETLRSRLDELVGDRRRLLQMSLAARQSYLRQPSWEQSMTQAANFLHQLND